MFISACGHFSKLGVGSFIEQIFVLGGECVDFWWIADLLLRLGICDGLLITLLHCGIRMLGVYVGYLTCIALMSLGWIGCGRWSHGIYDICCSEFSGFLFII